MPDESIIIPIELKPGKGFEELAKVSNVVSKAITLVESTSDQVAGSFTNMGSAAAKSASLMTSAFTSVLKPIEQLEAEIGALELAIKKGTNIADLKRFNDQIAVLQRQINNMKVVGFETSLNKVGDAANRAGGQIQKLPGGLNPAIFSLTNMGRVLQDLPYGLIGVANNITPLIESMVALSANAKATGVSMGKQLLASITGGGGLIFGFSILTSVMQFATLGLSAFTRGASSTKSKTAEMKDEVFSFGKVIDEVAGDLSRSAGRVTTLFAALNSGKLNFDERKAALKELASVNKEFFGSLKEEEGLIKGLQSAYDGYLGRLKEIGRAKAIESQLTKLFDKKLTLELSVDPKFISAIDPLVQQQVGKLKKELASLGGAVDLSKTDFSKTLPDFGTGKAKEFGKVTSDSLSVVLGNVEKVDAAEKKEQQTLQRRIYLMQRIAQFENEGGIHFVPGVLEGTQNQINNIDLQIKALSDLLKSTGNFEIDIPAPKDDNLEKEMDKIIARARLFVKEFGDVFETPDLDESFFKSKLQVFLDAQKLLDDISKKNLKIKLPKVDFTQTDGLVPFTPEVDPNFKFDEDGKIKEGILKQMQSEVQESGPFDITIPTKATIDLETDMRKKLDAAFKSGDFKGILDSLDLDKREGFFKGLKEDVKASAALMNDTLTPAFEGMFDAIIKGENPLKAFFNSIIQSINQVIQRLIAAAIQAAILSAITPGANQFGSFFGKLFSGGGGIANFGNRVGFAGGGAGAMNVSVTGVLRGPDIYLSGFRGGQAIGRTGG
jgi:hypothetical protein